MFFSKIVKSSKKLILTQVKSFSAKDNLLNCFKQELEYEEKEYKPISAEEKKLFFNQSGFEFIESQTSARMELKKKVNGFDVSVCYHARSPMPEEENEGKEEEGPANMVDFQILINKSGSQGGFLVDAVVMDSQLNINTVHVSEDLKDYHNRYLTGRVDPDVYQGPDFSTLDDSLQHAFMDFLADLGINEECASFIEISSLDKDQQLYMNWLKSAKNILI